MPRFSLEVTPAVKKEEGWGATALATVLYGNRPPDPPEEIIFVVNGEEFERTETNPESGIARSTMILQSGGYVVTAIRSRVRPDDREARKTRNFVIRAERQPTDDEKRVAEARTQIELAKLEKELERAIRPEKEPTPDEKKTIALKARLERVKAEQELKEAERKLARELKKTRFSEPIPEVQIIVAESVKEEKTPEKAPRPPLSQRIREAYTQERNKGKPPAFEFKIQRRQPLIFFSND